MTAPLRIGICGCGRLARAGYVPALSRLPTLRVDAVADPDPHRRAALARALAGDGSAPRVYSGIEEMLAGGRLDGVIVSSPAHAHVADARAAAADGLPALVEKPPAPDLDGAIELALLDPQPWLGFNRRFGRFAALRRAARELRGGAGFEDPLELELELRYRRASWRPHAVRDDVLLDLGPHAIDLAAWTLGRRPTAVRTHAASFARAELELWLGRSSARISLASDRPHLERAAVGPPGTPPSLVLRSDGALAGLAARLRGAEHPLVATLRAELAAFGESLRGAGSGELGIAGNGVAVMAAIEAARESARSGGAVVEIASAERLLSATEPPLEAPPAAEDAREAA